MNTQDSIQTIGRQEESKNEKIKKKHSETTLMTTADRTLRDELAATARMTKNVEESIRANAHTRAQLEIARIRSQARAQQLDVLHRNIEELKTNVEKELSGVWVQREEFCSAAAALSEQCGVSALLATRARAELPPPPALPARRPPSVAVPLESATVGLRNAERRRERLLDERNQLQLEPERGEEFIRKFLQGNKFNYRIFSSSVEENENAPVKFSTSPAAKRTLSIVRNTSHQSVPWYQPLIVCGSVTVFLIYFCILREENDIDKEFDKTLYERIEGLEKEQLLLAYRYNKENGRSVEDLELRLKEIGAIEATA